MGLCFGFDLIGSFLGYLSRNFRIQSPFFVVSLLWVFLLDCVGAVYLVFVSLCLCFVGPMKEFCLSKRSPFGCCRLGLIASVKAFLPEILGAQVSTLLKPFRFQYFMLSALGSCDYFSLLGMIA